MKEVKTTFTAYIEKVAKLQCLFTGNTNLVIYLKWIISEDGIYKNKLRMEVTRDYGLGKLSENDKIEFEGLYTIVANDEVVIRKTYNLRRIL